MKVIALQPLFNKHVTGCYMIPSLDVLLDIYSGLYFLLCGIKLFIIFSFDIFIVSSVQRGKQGIHVKHFMLYLKGFSPSVTLFISEGQSFTNLIVTVKSVI